jgi:DNA (cytosine-5)-methyltransferase 1
MTLTAVDLYCGAGGTTLGLLKAGFEIVGAFDSWLPAVESYRKNFPFPLLNSDIQNISEKQIRDFVGSTSVDLLAGCPPCHGFSMNYDRAGKDRTPYPLFQFIRLIDALSPRAVLIADIPVFFGRSGRDFTEEFISSLTSRGYAVEYHRINAAEYGVPQIRRRLYYFGWRGSKGSEFTLPLPDHQRRFVTVRDAIGDLPSPHNEADELGGDPLHRPINTSELNLKRLKYVRPGKGYLDIPEELWPFHRHNGRDKFRRDDAYGRLDYDMPAGVINAGFDSFTRGKFGHPSENRNITLREGARLQTFPDDFRFCGNQRDTVRLIGNTAPPRMVAIMGSALANHLRGVDKNLGLQDTYIMPAPSPAVSSNGGGTRKSSSGARLRGGGVKRSGLATSRTIPEPSPAAEKHIDINSRSYRAKSKQPSLPLLDGMQAKSLVNHDGDGDQASLRVVKSARAECVRRSTRLPATAPNRQNVGDENQADVSQATPLLKVFLCHSYKDKPAVRTLYRRLVVDGVSPWLDEENLLPGQKWDVEIPKAVQSSDAVIICLSNSSTTKRGYVQKEIRYALDIAAEQPEDTIFLIPLRLEECNVPTSLSKIQWVDFFDDRGYERLMLALKTRASSL